MDFRGEPFIVSATLMETTTVIRLVSCGCGSTLVEITEPRKITLPAE